MSENITPTERADNAIKWIDNLHFYKQAPIDNRGQLGDEDEGFCCLGAGCRILGIDFEVVDTHSHNFMNSVGLKNLEGDMYQENASKYYEKDSLASINDYTNAGFKRIATLMKTHPKWMFKEAVAILIENHYSKQVN